MPQDKKKSSTELAKDNLESLKSGIEDLKKIQKGSYFSTSSDAYSSNPSNEKKINKTPTDKECKKCKSSNSLNALYCKSCGEKLFEEKKIITRKCDKCGNEYDSSYDFCPKDGGEIIDQETIVKETYQKTMEDSSKKNTDNLGFGWGNFYLAVSFLGSIFSLILTLIGFYEKVMPISIFVVLVQSIFFGTISYGIYKRKKWFIPLFKSWVFLLLFFNVVYFFENVNTYTFRELGSLILALCYYNYFMKRKYMFVNK